MVNAETESATRNNRTICLPFSQEYYEANIIDLIDFRKCIDERIVLFPPELFPPEICSGYQMRAPSKANTGKPDNPARVRVNLNPLLSLARSEGFEPPAYRFEERLVVSELSISLEAKTIAGVN